MSDALIDFFRTNSIIVIFLTLGLGSWLGSIKVKSFSLGPVTATLIVGVLFGQMNIPVSDTIKSIFFMLFMFSIGYSVGPHFFRSIKGEGLKQMIFAFVECCLCIAVCLVVCRLMGYGKGTSVGIFAGSQAFSAVIGVGADTISSMNLSPDEQKKQISLIPACYAVCYVFGTIGSAWVVGNLGPKLLGGLEKVKRDTAELEAELDNGDLVPEPGSFIANRTIAFRAYKAETEFFKKPRSVIEIERYLKKRGLYHFVLRLRIRGEIYDPEPDLKVHLGDTIVISGRRQSVVNDSGWIGPEVIDDELLDFTADKFPVTVSKKSEAAGLTLGELRQKRFMKGVLIQKLLRNEIRIPLRSQIVLEPGDIVTLVGLPEAAAVAASEIGYSDRDSDETDLTFMGIGIAIGCFIGALSLHLMGVPLSLTMSGGTLMSGLVLGYVRYKHPTFGNIPSPVLWFMDKFGLNMFIAAIGISAGPSFIYGLKEAGVLLFFVGIICTTLPLILSIIIGDKIFHFRPAVTLGCVAGSRNAVAALGAVQENLGSSLPAMSYTVTCAVGSLFFVLAGIVMAVFS